MEKGSLGMETGKPCLHWNREELKPDCTGTFHPQPSGVFPPAHHPNPQSRRARIPKILRPPNTAPPKGGILPRRVPGAFPPSHLPIPPAHRSPPAPLSHPGPTLGGWMRGPGCCWSGDRGAAGAAGGAGAGGGCRVPARTAECRRASPSPGTGKDRPQADRTAGGRGDVGRASLPPPARLLPPALSPAPNSGLSQGAGRKGGRARGRKVFRSWNKA